MPSLDVESIVTLERTGAAQILLYLYIHRDSGETNITELTQNIKATRETILRTIDYLATDNLIIETIMQAFPFQHKVKLSEKGIAAGQLLFELAQALQSQHK
jgi:DNA-binding HxlR family transcriptional regulator